MTPDKRKEIARQIADALFRSDAIRLQIKLAGSRPGVAYERDGGGWCKKAVIDQIEIILAEARRGQHR